jgi:hypothetical protein
MKKPTMKQNKLAAPLHWTDNMQWYEQAPAALRDDFAVKYCSNVLTLHGQTCVVISYPRQNGRVALYDMDGGVILWCDLEALSELTVGRKTEESDFYWSEILDSCLCDEASDIWFRLEDSRSV